MALARTVRQHLMSRWLETLSKQMGPQAKAVAYLSAEYLLGRQLDNALLAAGLDDTAERRCGPSVSTWKAARRRDRAGPGQRRPRPAGRVLHRLAGDPGGAVRRLRHPLRVRHLPADLRRRQQVEQPDSWLGTARRGSSRTPRRPSRSASAATPSSTGRGRRHPARWDPDWEVLGVPYNYMVPGYRDGRVNTLRLWSAKATQAFDLQVFNAGDYLEAVRAQTFAENISQGAVPRGLHPAGQGAAPAAAVLLRRLLAARLHRPRPAARLRPARLPERVIFQLNDTHPVIAVPELMRILVDEKRMDWDEAWEITRKCFAYTCHTLLPEALEVWPVDLLGRLLPRHLEIIYRINDDFLDEVRAAFPGDELRVRRMSIIAEDPERAVRMAYLATVAGAKVNGVAELHTQLLRDKVLATSPRCGRTKFTNVTNGVTPRRFVAAGEPGAVPADHRGDRRRLGHRPGPAARARALRRRRGVPARVRRGQGAQQGAAGGRCWPAATASCSNPTPCST